MQKKRILQIVPEISEKTGVIAKNVEIRGEKHLLMDFYDTGEWWLRYAFSEKDYSRYIVSEEKWTRKNRWEVEINERGYLSNAIRNLSFIDKKSEKAAKQWSKEKNVNDIIYNLENKI